MSELIHRLVHKKLIHLPSWLHPTNVHMLTLMGSQAYGCNEVKVKDTPTDYDIYGFAMPPLERMFPSKAGHVIGFADWKNPRSRIEDNDPWQKAHIFEKETNKEWDFQIFGIVRYFELLRTGNANVLDSLFTPENCIIHITDIGRLVRDNRQKFLSKMVWKTFRGYALAQLKKMDVKNPEGGRKKIVEKYSFDVKSAYHIYRLYSEVEQILTKKDMNLQQDKEAMKAIRRGEWTSQQIHDFVAEKDIALESLYTRCDLPDQPNIAELKELLIRCIELHYGSLGSVYNQPNWSVDTLKKIRTLIEEQSENLSCS